MVRIGIIGLGWMGQLHARYLKRVRDAKLSAVCDMNDILLEQIAQYYGVYAFNDYKRLLGCDEIDAVYIATPQKDHYEIMKEAISIGKHILCEKPLALTHEEIADLRKRAKVSKGKIIIDFPERFVISTQESVDLIDQGAVGEVRFIRANFRFSMKDHHQTHGSWVFDRSQGGGLILESSVHLWDMIRWISKQEIVSVSAVAHNLEGAQVEDSFAAIAYMENGGIVMVDMSGWLPKESATDKRMEIIGSDGTIYIDEFRNILTIHSENGLENNPGMVTAGMTHKDLLWHSSIEGGVKRLSQYFIDCIENDIQPYPCVEDGARATEITWSILKSLESGRLEVVTYGG